MDSTTVLVVIFLLIGSAFFSATETAFSAVNLLRLRSMAEEGDKRAKTAVKILSQFDKMLITILIGNNVVNIGLSSLTTLIATQAFGSSGAGIATGVTTLLVLTFGEIIPKSLAKQYCEILVLTFSKILSLFMFVLTPISVIFIKLRYIFAKGDASKQPTMTEQELLYMLNAIEEEGVLETQEKNLVRSALEFDETTAQEILTPRVNIVALDVDDDQETILSLIVTEGYSRIPVYEDSIDNIIGLVKSREILQRVIKGEKIDLRTLMSEVKYIHRTKKLSSLLGEFQREKVHFAVIIDDYGGTLGILTMEDLLEEIVGEIWDEDDEVEQKVRQETDGTYTVDGDTSIEDFFEFAQYQPKNFESSYSTMNGWSLECLEHIPEVGERFTFGILEVTVKAMDDQRVTKLSVKKIPAEHEEE